jgi:glutamate-1-semialdehyde aminotransferase
MPFFKFKHPDPETNARLTRTFFRHVIARGSLLHPRHMWFISHAHTSADITETLEAARLAMKAAVRTLDAV